MEFIIIGIISLILMLVLKLVFGYNQKELRTIVKNEELDKIAEKYPENIQMCKSYLKKLGNEKVEIEENKETENSLYMVVTNKIMIANIQKSYTRIQTIAHECLHSVQDKKLLWFNFIFSNLYILYFLVICILAIFRVLPYEIMFLIGYLILSCIFILVRGYLENDAMIKARYLAKEYMEEQKISSKEEIQKIVNEFDKINNVGIKATNYYFFMQIMMQLFVFCTICLIR